MQYFNMQCGHLILHVLCRYDLLGGPTFCVHQCVYVKSIVLCATVQGHLFKGGKCVRVKKEAIVAVGDEE